MSKAAGSWVARDLQPDWSSLPPRPSVEEVAPGFLLFAGASNNYVLDTSDGLFIVDPGHERTADAFFDAVRAWRDAPVHTVALTHGHMDHATGFGRFRREGERPDVVAQENYARRLDRYRETRGFNEHINRRQFSNPEFHFPTDFVEPTITFRDELAIEVGGLDVRLRAAKGETDDYSTIWLPDRGILFVGDNATWKVPNSGNPLKVQRYPVEWIAALEHMASLNAEWLCPGHDLVLHGRDNVRTFLTSHARYLRSLVDQVRERLNAGQTVDEVVHGVKPDASLAALPFLRDVYNHPQFIVRDILRYWGGWWDGVGGHLLPALVADQAREIARLAGGVSALVSRSRALLVEGELVLACHLVDWAVQAEPTSVTVQEARRDVYEARAAAERVGMPKGFFRTEAEDAARALTRLEEGNPGRGEAR